MVQPTNREPSPAISRETSICSGVSMLTLSVHSIPYTLSGPWEDVPATI